MCGIAGFIDPSEAQASVALRRMLGRMIHRGPDGEGTHFEPGDGLALGMRRLSIIDLEGGWQPVWNEDETICVINNGEIYNYLELRRDLQSSGHRFRTSSDTEVLVHLYEEFGNRLTERLRGMFAFCIFDRRKHTLFLARDHFGQKPLYYTFSGGRFAFASELKGLLALSWVKRDLDADAFLDYAAWLALPSPRTHFRGIQKLPAGCTLSVRLSNPEPIVTCYWCYDITAEPDLTNLDEAIAELDHALEESVSVHLRADVPVGVLLSSGLDSRTVLAYATALQKRQMHSFSVGFKSEDSELEGAAQTARELGSHHHELELSAYDLAQGMDRVVALLDEPVADPACFAVARISELAREYVKVILSGEGSDELFGGYEGRYAGMLATMERTQRFRWAAPYLPNASVHASPWRWQRFLARAHSSPASEAAALRICALPGNIRAPRMLSISQLRTLYQRTHVLGDAVLRPQRDDLSTLLVFDVDWNLAESLLQKADKMSMGASIELRTPLLDIEVAKVAARIPSSLKLPPGGPGKFILRKVLAARMDEPMNRPKKGFPVPLNNWLAGPLREQLEGELFASNSVVCTHLDRRGLEAGRADVIAGKGGGSMFFALWLYERWCTSLRQAGSGLN